MANNGLGNLLSFNKMISEQIIKIVYYIGLIGIALAFLGKLYLSLTSGLGSFIPILAGSIVAAILSVLLWRVFCESIIILFRMYSRLGDINETLGGTNTEKPIPGDEALKEVRAAALKAKAAAAEKAKALKSSIAKDDGSEPTELDLDLKPASSTPVRKPAARKPAAKKAATRKPAVKKTAPKKPAAKKAPVKKTAAKKTTTRKKPAGKK